MSVHSLRRRLLTGTLAWVLASIALAGWGLRELFVSHITEQLQEQLLVQLNQLSAAVDWNADGRVTVGPMAADARFEQPLSGLYWQVDELGDRPRAAVARSRSLWDQTLRLPPPPAQYPAAGHRVLRLQDAQGHDLLAVARPLQLPDDAAPPLRVVVAGDRALLAEPLQRFTRLLLVALAMLAVGLAAAVVLQLQLALRPLTLLRQRLAAVRSGEATQLSGDFPQELQPLVGEFNHVLRENADMVQRARAQAGNLAHALKTPLTVLAQAAREAPASTDAAAALPALVEEQVALSRRHVEWHLARSRAAAAQGVVGMRTAIRPTVDGLARVLAKLYADRQLVLSIDVAPTLAFAGEAQDLQEMLGNLLDNAFKAARSRMQIAATIEQDRLRITVDDDGPGIADEHLADALRRGIRLDEATPGSGLGLAIVDELASLYGGALTLGRSSWGGLRATLLLPGAPG